MVEISCTVSIPKTSQELDQAIQHYQTSELSGSELFCQWQAIRIAALEQSISEVEGDRVPGEDSY